MQRPLSVSELKGTSSPKQHQDKPREGTKFREVYDRLFANAGSEIPLDFDPTILSSLINFYGLDIRPVQRKSFKNNRGPTCVLAGYWDGNIYIDCIATNPNSTLFKTPRSRE
jgi:hypothetical protein